MANDGPTTPNRIEVTLECKHSLFFKPPYALIPKPGDWLWCLKCEKEIQVYPAYVRMGTMYMDTWSSTPYGKTGIIGKCLHIEDGVKCAYEAKNTNWHRLELNLHRHYMREHTRFGATLTITVIDRLPPNSPPPF